MTSLRIALAVCALLTGGVQAQTDSVIDSNETSMAAIASPTSRAKDHHRESLALLEPIIRTYIEPQGAVVVGQTVRVWVELSTKRWFSRAPSYPELSVAGAITILPEQLGVNFTETNQGVTRSGQRQRYVVIPQRSGTLQIPAMTIDFAASLDSGESLDLALVSEALEVDVSAPQAMRGVSTWVAVPEMRVVEQWQGLLPGVSVGDAITRTITTSAENTFALALPAVNFSQVDGTRRYTQTPQLEDQVNRGRYQASRIDQATYVLQQSGPITLPALSVDWWDTENGKPKRIELPEVALDVATAPKDATHAAPIAARYGQRLLAYLQQGLDWLRLNDRLILAMLVALYVIKRIYQRFADHVRAATRKRWREAWHSSSRHYLVFSAHCLLNRRDLIPSSLWRWRASVDTALRQTAEESALYQQMSPLYMPRAEPLNWRRRLALQRRAATLHRRERQAQPLNDRSDSPCLNPRA
ncbi:BatD family protein [Gammaproteobacteria bacterium]|nr:BatD family protein [Gammaproteobacteria bacterium]